MAFATLKNVKLSGITTCVPKLTHTTNNSKTSILSHEEMQRISKVTGIENKRIVSENTCTSDLCFKAAEELIDNLAWNKEDIGILIFVSQTPDYILPNTSIILQNRLGLSKETICFDMTLGCSGYVYGMFALASILGNGFIKKGLLLVGDTSSKIISKTDRSTAPLFGDAGTATAFEYDSQAHFMNFHLASDGSGAEMIMVKDGGQRNPFFQNSLDVVDYGEEIVRNNCQLSLNGLDIFNFGISQVPKAVKNLLDYTQKNIEQTDYFIFHQANLLMNETIRKKVGIPKEKVPYSLKDFGNTSSATIPLTITTQLANKVTKESLNMVFCGFGVGLSWATAYVNIDKIICPPLIEL
jgi:3-oxoacyl-[acyl-carrier-protein] synthase III